MFFTFTSDTVRSDSWKKVFGGVLGPVVSVGGRRGGVWVEVLGILSGV